MLVIDSHMHVQSMPEHDWHSPPERILSLMDEAGIHAAFIMGYGEASTEEPALIHEMMDVGRKYPNRLFPMARLKPCKGAPELLKKLIREVGFLGLKLHPVGYRLQPDHPHVIDLLRMAGHLGVPVLFHSGDEEYSFPLQIARAARKCPETQIILGHMGGYFHVNDAILAAKQNPNIFLETSAMPYPSKIRDAVRALGARRILFGSDGPGCLPALEIEKVYLSQISSEDLEWVMGQSFLKLLLPDQRERVIEAGDLQLSRLSPSNQGLQGVFDHRIHLDCESWNQKSGIVSRRVVGTSRDQIQEAMRASDVASGNLMPGYCRKGYLDANEIVVSVAAQLGMKAYGRLDPSQSQTCDQVEKLARSGTLAGVFLHPYEDGFSANDERVVSLANELVPDQVPIMIAGGYPMVSQPSQITSLAEMAPDTKIIVTSAGQIDICGAHLESAMNMMERSSNLIAETSGIYRQDFIEKLISKFGTDRVVFGSGFPAYEMTYEALRMQWLHLNSDIVQAVVREYQPDFPPK
jgi:uncharacterized protein